MEETVPYRPATLVHYWAGCPQTPNSKWQRFLHLLRGCADRGWRTHLVWSHLPDNRALVRPFEDFGCRIHLQPRVSRNFDPMCVLRTYCLLRQVKCDIFHCHNVHTSPLIAAAMARVPVRIWSKISMSPYYEQGVAPSGIHRLAPSIRVSCALAHRVLAISHAVRDELIAFGAKAEKVLVWPQPVDVGRYAGAPAGGIRRELGLSASHVVLTTVGHAVPVKGWDILIDAFAQVRSTVPNASLLLVGSATGNGETDFAQTLFRRVDELGLDREVHFLGQRADIPQILRASDIFVFPSRSDGQGLALTEALAAGLPCVASRAGGIVDLIEDGDNGLLFDREDVDGLAAHLQELLRDGDLRRCLADRGKQSVQSLSLDRVTRRTIDLYDALLAERDSRDKTPESAIV